VKKGQKALTLCMPLTCKRTKTVKKDDGTGQEEEFSFTHFAYKAHWFVLAQTDGAEYQPPAIPDWNEERADAVLDIHRVPFEDLDGNARGYAKRGRKIAVSSPTGTQTVAQGGHGQYTIKIPSAVGTFSGPVTLTCSNLPAQATCAFSPNPITPGPDGVTTQLTITTAVPSSAMTVPHIVGPPPAALPAILLAMMLTALVGWWRVRRESLRWLVAPCSLFGALLATTFMAGCGGGGYPLAKVGSTPSGTYTITVTGTSGTMEHTTAVTLNVTAY